MKKIFAIFTVLLMLLTVPVFAEEEVVDEATQKEAEAIQNIHGASVRLLQLEKVIQRNVNAGNEVIAALKEQDTTELESVISELETLKQTISEIDVESKDANELAQEYVDLKSQAIELSKQFRDLHKDKFTIEEREQIRNQIKEKNIDNSEMQKIRNKIQTHTREYNADMLMELLETIDKQNMELVNKIRNGEAVPKEARNFVREEFKNLAPEDKVSTLEKIREKSIKRNVFRRSAIEKVKNTIKERRENRVEQNNAGEEIKQKLQDGSENGQAKRGGY